MNEQHEMVLDMAHPSGEEEWYCPTCGRRFLLQWPPAYKKIILEPGDELISHTGGKGYLQLDSLQSEPAVISDPENDLQSRSENSRLEPWIQWLDEVDFDDLWANES